MPKDRLRIIHAPPARLRSGYYGFGLGRRRDGIVDFRYPERKRAGSFRRVRVGRRIYRAVPIAPGSGAKTKVSANSFGGP